MKHPSSFEDTTYSRLLLFLCLTVRAVYLIFYFLIEKEGFHFYRFDDIIRTLTALDWSIDPRWLFNEHWLPFPFWLNGAVIRVSSNPLYSPICLNIVLSSLLLWGLYLLSRKLFSDESWSCLLPASFVGGGYLFNSLSLSGGSEILYIGLIIFGYLSLLLFLENKSFRFLSGGICLILLSELCRYEAWALGLTLTVILAMKIKPPIRQAWGLKAIILLSLPILPILFLKMECAHPIMGFPPGDILKSLSPIVRLSPTIIALSLLGLFTTARPPLVFYGASVICFLFLFIISYFALKFLEFTEIPRSVLVFVILISPFMVPAVRSIVSSLRLSRRPVLIVILAIASMLFSTYRIFQYRFDPQNEERELLHIGKIFVQSRSHITKDRFPIIWFDPTLSTGYEFSMSPMVIMYAAPATDSPYVPFMEHSYVHTREINSYPPDFQPDIVFTLTRSNVPPPHMVILGKTGHYTVWGRTDRRHYIYFKQMFKNLDRITERIGETPAPKEWNIGILDQLR
ncbi:MAG TPA: hypothetical protein PK876_03935 [Elusimicrobiota bacterium]|nr:hypothetical protein [Elusimicrobiota bacterium]